MHHAAHTVAYNEKYLIAGTMCDPSSRFGAASPFPPGFRHQAEVRSVEAERQLVDVIRTLPLREEFQFTATSASGAWCRTAPGTISRTRPCLAAEDFPAFLLPARDAAAAFAGLPAADIRQALITEYDVGASIGWHRHKSVFGDVIGLSLLSPCTFRLRRKAAGRWERVSVTAAPRPED